MGPGNWPTPCSPFGLSAKSEFENPAFVSAAITEGVGLWTMAPCARDQLTCIILGVAFNSAGKMCLICQ